ncbi:DEAD/DEAH box helicase [uncultured Catenibacterium sp.]|uniref:DEAD/DEAH box helicase n=1 Tax=uncultured Catenibacterium sp. TaxID=286142 RepID=UPI0025EAA751|nr:DEAD/DEAH box helicase [uncultured Catenibacterium sp.]
MDELNKALQTSFIDQSFPSNKDLRPKLFFNDYKRRMNLAFEITKRLKECDYFEFSVAFISESGLAVLKQILLNLKEKGVKGRIITSTYLGFNDPKMFKQLISFTNIEVRIFEQEHCGFHPKGFIFHKGEHRDIIVGSSNLTQTALESNQEWDLFFTSHENGELAAQVSNEFNIQWELSTPLTNEWIDNYKETYVKPVRHTLTHSSTTIKPNKMQEEALKSLKNLRDNSKDKALLISATGTGKTFLSAFDVKRFNPKRLLFIVHRRNIAEAALRSFNYLIPNVSMGIFSGNTKEADSDFIFSTVQTIHKKEYREMFDRDAFDYIIIDEVHRAGAKSYQDIVDYFKPKFLLGMSATPERSDDFDIYEMFDHNIAYEIRLVQAMEYNLLCPFHYYGITDMTIDGIEIDDKSEFNILTSELRADYIIEKINEYGYSGDRIHGLIFCSRKDECEKLSQLFNMRGYKTIALTGHSSEEMRQKAIDSLESNDEDSLDYIFTVDIFNEGIDIPKVNQVVMLRPTESAIVFVQQLGRGLRKNDSKEYVVIIDFIGNYEKNFLIPVALSGQTNYNKDSLRQFVCEGSLITPGASTIQFDQITEKRIYQSIDAANFTQVRLIKDSYKQLKEKLGRIPHLKEFEQYGAIDVQLMFQNKSLGCYHTFLSKYEKDYHVKFSALEVKYLQFISSKLSSGKRIEELEAIKLIINKRTNLITHLKETLNNIYQINLPAVGIETISNILSQNFMTGSSKKTFEDAVFIDENFESSPQFLKLLNNKDFKNQVMEVIEYAIDKNIKEYSNRYKNTDFCLYSKYTYEDVCRLLNWEKNIVPLNIGGYFYNSRTNTLPVFINYDKDESVVDTQKYADHFIDAQNFVAMSKSNVRITNPGMEKFVKAAENKTNIYLFIRKNKDDAASKEFYYLGEVYISKIEETTMANDVPVCEIYYHLDQPVRSDIYDYILS